MDIRLGLIIFCVSFLVTLSAWAIVWFFLKAADKKPNDFCRAWSKVDGSTDSMKSMGEGCDDYRPDGW